MTLPADFPRPEAHVFIPDPGSPDCAVCGLSFPFLHIEPEPPADLEPEPWWCSSCSHDRHSGPCRISVSPTRDMPCGCRERAA